MRAANWVTLAPVTLNATSIRPSRSATRSATWSLRASSTSSLTDRK